MTFTRQAPILVIPARDIGQKEAKTMGTMTATYQGKTVQVTFINWIEQTAWIEISPIGIEKVALSELS